MLKDVVEFWWVRWIKDVMLGEDEWEVERIKRRVEIKVWLGGRKNREVWEVEMGVSEERLSGIL